MSAPYITVNFEALKQNVFRLKQMLKGKMFLAMVKADAYGHGLIEVATAIQSDVDAFAVARIDEAQSLREQKITKPIVIMGGISSIESLQKAILLNCDIVIHHPKHLQLLKQLPKISPLNIWVKVQSSMHRLGFRLEDIDSVLESLSLMDIKPTTFLTHLPSIENDDKSTLMAQVSAFLTKVKPYQANISISNTAGLLKYADVFINETDVFRIGRAMYGVSPSSQLPIKSLGLKAVMSFHAEIISINDLLPGESIGYHSQYTAEQKERIAIINVGYGDGYPRCRDGFVYFKGCLCPIRGWLSMDMTAIAIPNEITAQIGDAVQLWGEHIAVESLARSINRSALENLMSLAPRVKRIYIPVHKKEEVLL